MDSTGKLLVVIGAIVVVAGAVVWIGGRLGLGRLPGDIVVTRGNAKIYAPIATSLLLSVVLTIALTIAARFWR